MLKAAQLYEDELQKKVIQSWYDQSNMYWNGEEGCSTIDLPDNCVDSHNFVSVDENNEVIGYIAYSIDWDVMSVNDVCIISFDKGNLQFGRDLKQAVTDIFEKYGMNRMSWYCHADNPTIKAYRNFVRLNGGAECGHFKQYSRLSDGQLHDSVLFEIMFTDYESAKQKRLLAIDTRKTQRKIEDLEKKINNLSKNANA